MGRPDDDAQLGKFLGVLRSLGGSAGNSRLMSDLGWSENEYWRLRDKLLDAGQLIRGRGRGGSVSIVETMPPQITTSQPSATAISTAGEIAEEADLYPPCKTVLEEHWAREINLQNCHVEITARQGRRATGGIWTRPDIAALSMRTFPHWPGRFFDIWTFEIKPIWAFDVTGVYEASAHSRSATHSYAMFHIPDKPDEDNVVRCAGEAQRLGLGLVLFTDPTDFSKWDFKVEPVRREPDPALLEQFVATQLSEEARTKLLRWGK